MPAATRQAVLAAASLVLVVALSVAGSAGALRSSNRSADSQAPSAPTNLRLESATQYSVSVGWNAGTDNVGVAAYYLYLDDRRERVSGTSYTINARECGQSVSFSVAAVDRAGNVSPRASATVSTAACVDLARPTPPAGFHQLATSQTAVVVAWAASADNVGVVSYGVYRSALLVDTTAEPNVTLDGLVCGSAYQYAVDAVDAAGNRSPRRWTWVQTAACGDGQPPTAPTGVEVTSRTTESLGLRWSPSRDNVGVAGYRILLDGRAAKTSKSSSVELSKLPCSSTYSVAVDAYDAAGNR